MIRYVPNVLTLLRLALVPYVLRLLWRHEYGWAVFWGGLASVTDALDGFLARRLGARTRIGAYLDPVADKLLLSGAYLVFGLTGAIPWWITAIVLGRDLLILLFVAAAFLFTTVREFPPSVWGKVSTLTQICAGLAVLIAGIVTVPAAVVWFALMLAAAATIWSLIHYAFAAAGIVRRARSQAAGSAQRTAH